ncbi:MAG: hypothetical protein JXA18_02305 [Chitinispirillaceae bacterium]|nr:hypothetical protein [Chitinispirillaceae bacterium]
MKNRLGLIRFASGAATSGLLLLVACIGTVDEGDTRYSEMESVWQYLRVYSIYQDSSLYEGRIPADAFVYSDPVEMMNAVGDTLYGETYTCYGTYSFLNGWPSLRRQGRMRQSAATLPVLAALDTLTDSTVRMTIISFDDGITYNEFIDLLPGVQPFPIVIVDLCGNGGGNIEEAQLVIDAFVPSGQSYIRAREREYDEEKRTARTLDWHPWKTKDLARLELKDKRITILMDNNSASASEILIAALKDCLGATLVGSRTYGKGIGQIEVRRRDRSGLKITFLQMRGISDRIGDYHRRGIEPDVPASGTEKEVLLAAVKVHEPSATSLRKLRKRTITPTPVAGYRVVWE